MGTIAPPSSKFRLANLMDLPEHSAMSTVAEIETALRKLPTPEAQEVARWLQKHLQQQIDSNTSGLAKSTVIVPDYAARRRKILGDKVLPNMVVTGREQERW
jgi:hypothetical protein